LIKGALGLADEFVKSENLTEVKQLCSGIFWVLSDHFDLSDHKFLMFGIPCDPNGVPNNTHSIELNSKSGNTYNHKKIWDSEVRNNKDYRPYNRKDHDYYPSKRQDRDLSQSSYYLFESSYQ
jgi:hypothetical protein